MSALNPYLHASDEQLAALLRAMRDGRVRLTRREERHALHEAAVRLADRRPPRE